MDGDLTLLWMPAVTFAASLVLVPAVRTIARGAGTLAYPDAVRRFHAVPVPLWGGVAVYLAWLLGILVIRLGPAAGNPALADLCRCLIPAAGLACLFGALDDRWDLSPRRKLLLQVLAITPIVAAGYWVDFLVIFGCRIELGGFGIPLTILWLLGCINALNLIDGMDGLASLVGLSTATMMALVALSMGNGHVAMLAFLLAGALAGFLLYNLPPASIFLGDSGSTLVGLVLGTLGIAGSLKTSATLSITAPAVVMTLPMFDVLMALVRRRLTGRRFDVGDREHIHHRLLERGFGPRQVLCVVSALCLTTGAAATAATIFRMDALAWITATTLIVLLIRLRWFGHYEVSLVRVAVRRGLTRCAKPFTRQETHPAAAPQEVACDAGGAAGEMPTIVATMPAATHCRKAT
jgi:UDP-GlcNAc:undecaprenyl-phosphate GlcNAc-1-phosphate transferase